MVAGCWTVQGRPDSTDAPRFVMNGGLIVGTMDGANIEIREECGSLESRDRKPSGVSWHWVKWSSTNDDELERITCCWCFPWSIRSSEVGSPARPRQWHNVHLRVPGTRGAECRSRSWDRICRWFDQDLYSLVIIPWLALLNYSKPSLCHYYID